MSKTIRRVVDGFFKGWQLGLQGQHYADQRADRKEQREIARASAAAAERRHQDRIGLDREKAAAYIEQARANAARLRAKAAGGGGAGGPSSGAQEFLADMQGIGLDVSVPERQPTYTTVQPDDPPTVLEPPAASSDPDTVPAAARGGKISRGLSMGLVQGMNYANRARQQARTPPINPAPQDQPGIRRVASTQTYNPTNQAVQPVQGSAGTSGPGSGYGDTAAPPVTAAIQTEPLPDLTGTYRRGGRVRRYQVGGMVDPNLDAMAASNRMMINRNAEAAEYDTTTRRSGGGAGAGGAGSWWDGGSADGATGAPGVGSSETGEAGSVGAAVGVDAGTSGEAFRRGGRVQHFQQGGVPLSWGERMAQRLRQRFPYSRDYVPTPAPNPYNPNPGPPAPPSATAPVTGGFGAQSYTVRPPAPAPAAPPRAQVRIPPPTNYDATDYEQMPNRQVTQGETGEFPEVDAPTTPYPSGPVNGGGGGGGGGGGAPRAPRGGGLGDQRREAAYDPVADRMDPRNIGVVYDDGRVNPMVYAATQHGGIELNAPGQQIYRRGGRVRSRMPRFADGGPVSYPVDPSEMTPTQRMQSLSWRNQSSAMPPGETGGQPEAGMPSRYPSTPIERMSDRDFDIYMQGAADKTRYDQSLQRGPTGGADVDPRQQRGAPAPPTRPTAHDEGAGSPLQTYDPNEPTRPTAHDEGAGSPLQTYPPGNGPPARRGNGAINTAQRPWKPLRDQTRTEAFDPTKDRADPDNVNIVDDTGRVNPQQGPPAPTGGQQARGRGQPALYTGEGGEGLRGREGQNRDLSTNNAAADYASAATSYAERTFSPAGEQGRAQLYNGAGAPDPKTTEQLMQVVDPKGQMPVGDRIVAAANSAYQFYKQQGNDAEADKAAFEITQYGVSKSREHGVTAVKLAQGGNLQGAVEELTKGYEWLPNGQRAVVQGGQIVILDKSNKPVMNLPLNAQTINNIAMGMATGQLGWDVMRRAGQPSQPPPSGAPPSGPTRPAAQPSAAPAGPATSPAAPPTQRPAAASPAARPTQAVQTTVPTAPAGPPRPTQGAAPPAPVRTPPSQTPAPAQRGGPPNVTAQPQRTPPQGGGEPSEADQKKAQEAHEKALNEWYAKNPDKPPPGDIARETAQDPKDVRQIEQKLQALDAEYAETRRMIMAHGQKKLGKGEGKYLTQTLQTLKTRYDNKRKELVGQRDSYTKEQNAQDRYDREVTLKPRQVTYDQEKQIEKQQSDRMDAQTKDKEFKAANQNTVLRYAMTPTQRSEVLQLSKELWRQNQHLTADRALDLAIGMTAIKPDGVGLNGQKGKDALQYRVEAGNARRGYRVQVPNGYVHVDNNTHRLMRQIQTQNWEHHERKGKDAAKDKAEADRRGSNLVSRGARAIAPLLPPPIGPLVSGVGQLTR